MGLPVVLPPEYSMQIRVVLMTPAAPQVAVQLVEPVVVQLYVAVGGNTTGGET